MEILFKICILVENFFGNDFFYFIFNVYCYLFEGLIGQFNKKKA